MRKDTSFSITKTIRLQGKLFDFSTPRIMGILNLTPDSFYDGGRYITEDAIMARTEQLLEQGCDIIDAGAFSSRPGAEEVSPEEESARLVRGLAIIRKRFPGVPVSVDTFRAAVARVAVKQWDVDMINDISAGDMDPDMFDTIADLGVPYVIMHMQGTPKDMQDDPRYDHVVKDILKYFSRKLAQLRERGVKDVIVDPGFGFGKTMEHNYQLLKGLEAFRILDVPLMVGLSRKSMIYKVLNVPPEEALNGTTVLHTLALLGGADILRVHDPREALETIRLVQIFNRAKLPGR
ncbi:MAG: dihydropteroate synthase [Chlorobi bacterium]|nr:dihydropteroate synthase [Chlorobiota bacterium]